MSAAPENPSAFPPHGAFHAGMPLRDYFAGQALLVLPHVWPDWRNPGSLADQAYKFADAMLAERAKATGPAA